MTKKLNKGTKSVQFSEFLMHQLRTKRITALGHYKTCRLILFNISATQKDLYFLLQV